MRGDNASDALLGHSHLTEGGEVEEAAAGEVKKEEVTAKRAEEKPTPTKGERKK